MCILPKSLRRECEKLNKTVNFSYFWDIFTPFLSVVQRSPFFLYFFKNKKNFSEGGRRGTTATQQHAKAAAAREIKLRNNLEILPPSMRKILFCLDSEINWAYRNHLEFIALTLCTTTTTRLCMHIGARTVKNKLARHWRNIDVNFVQTCHDSIL